MQALEDLHARYEALRERDRVIASLQSKQRMLSVFAVLLDDDARAQIDTRLLAALDDVRTQARALAVELARAVFVALDIDDLARITTQLRGFEQHLTENPAECLDTCGDLLTFIRDLRESSAPIRPQRHPDD